MNERIQKVTRYKTPDGEEFSTVLGAEMHIDELDMAERATQLLKEGVSVGEIYRTVYGWKDIDPILDQITKDTELVIPHWQCPDTPGYKVKHFRDRRDMWVYGNAGSWSDSYGNWCTVDDVARYARHENTKFQSIPSAPEPQPSFCTSCGQPSEVNDLCLPCAEQGSKEALK